MSDVIKNQEKGRASGVKEFADEVYQQCVNKEWSIGDFGFFAQLINLRKESAYSEARQQVIENSPLPSRR